MVKTKLREKILKTRGTLRACCTTHARSGWADKPATWTRLPLCNENRTACTAGWMRGPAVVFVGLDVHSSRIAICVLSEKGSFAQLGRWSAAAAFDRSLELNPANHERWCLAAAVHAASGDVEGYRRTCRGMLERFGETDQPRMAEQTAKACLLHPDALSAADFDRVQKLAVRAITDTEKDGLYRYFVMAKGLADYRAGRHADAGKWLQQFPPNPDGTHWDATKFAVLAMAERGLGRAQQAEVFLAKAKAILTKKMPDPAKGQPFAAGHWPAWLHAQVLCHEAEELMKKESGKKPN